MSDKSIRFAILKYLYKYAIRHPSDSYASKEDIFKELKKCKKIKENELDFHIDYLEKKNLVRLERFLGGGFIAQITVYGIDLIESKNRE